MPAGTYWKITKDCVAEHVAEGKRKAYEVKLNSGSIIKLVTESGDIAEGDCVSVEQGQSANIRRVSSVYCEDPDHEALKLPQVQAAAQNVTQPKRLP